jgi:hypothetical protein
MHEKLLDEIDDYSITNDFTSWNIRRYYWRDVKYQVSVYDLICHLYEL